MSAAATTIDSSGSGLGQVVDARRISELPIREGTAVELVILAPGVQNTTDLRSRKAAFNNGLSQWSSDGAGEKRNDFTIDGVANVAADRVAYSPPSAAVEEFKIQTASYDAAVGNAMGASVNLVAKSGTNSLRGQVYEWFRGAARRQQLLRREERPAEARLQRQPVRRGGRRSHHAKPDLLLRQLRGQSVPGASPATLTVPTEKMRNGDFSELLALGSQYQIYDPATTRPHPTQAGRFIRDPFPGIIPQNRLDPVAKNILSFYPLNQAGTADGANNYTNPTAVAFETYYTVTSRVDHNFSDKHRLYGRFSWDFWEEEKDDRFDNLATGIFLNRKNRVFALDDAYTVKSNLLLNVRGGFTPAVPGAPSQHGLRPVVARVLELAGVADSAPLATFPNVTFDGSRTSARGSRATGSSPPTSTT